MGELQVPEMKEGWSCLQEWAQGAVQKGLGLAPFAGVAEVLGGAAWEGGGALVAAGFAAVQLGGLSTSAASVAVKRHYWLSIAGLESSMRL